MDHLRGELLRDHAAIELLSARLSKLIAANADATDLAETLGHLVQTVAGHLKVEEAILYDEAMLVQPGVTQADVTRATRTFERLKGDWGEYCTLWRAEDIAADRAGFVAASQAMLPRLRDRVQLETELLVLAGALQRRAG